MRIDGHRRQASWGVPHLTVASWPRRPWEVRAKADLLKGTFLPMSSPIY